MKKTLLVTILFIFVVFLSACYRTHATESTEETMVITVLNKADFDIYMIEINTRYLGGGIGYADGSKIRKGDLFSHVYLDGEHLDLKGEAVFDFAVIGEANRRVFLGGVSLELKPNTDYFFEVRGKSAEDAYLAVIDGEQ